MKRLFNITIDPIAYLLLVIILFALAIIYLFIAFASLVIYILFVK